jgi:thiol-disulfide isomerase/thioredoxin
MQREAPPITPPGRQPPPGGNNRPSGPEEKQKIGSPAPETVCHDLNGKEVKLSDLRGKVVVLDFWATWCGYCIKMIPDTTKLAEKMSGRPLAIVSISADAKQDTVTEFLKKTKMPWTHWWDGQNGPAVRLWGITGYPTVFVVDHKGIIRHKQIGYNPDPTEMDNIVEKLVKEAEKDGKPAPDGTKKPDTK